MGLAAVVTGPRNNLDFIRTILALGVLSLHTSQFIGVSYPQLPWVPAFIAISGYLITESMERSAGYMHFAWKRLLRIGPAFILSLALVVILGGNIRASIIDWVCMGLCDGRPGGNPPLWSLSLEEILYASLAMCFALGMYQTRMRALSWIILIYLVIAIAAEHMTISALAILLVVLSFLSGSFLYVARERIPWSPLLAVACLGAVLWMRNTSISGEMKYAYLMGPPIAYGLLTLGLHARPIFARYKSAIGDPSLGIYVYHFPVLNWMYIHDVRGAWLYVATLASTFLIALASWHLVEKHALKMKGAFLRRRRGESQPAVHSVRST